MLTFKCTICGDEFDREDLLDFRSMGEPYSTDPFICPDCYDRFMRMDPADQIRALVGEGLYGTKGKTEFVFS